MQQDPTAPDGSDAELITRVRSGDRTAFGTLYARHAGAATNLARQFARSSAEVDDLVSESFARVLDALLGGKGPDTAFRAYLFTTLRNTAFDRTRKDAKLQFTDDLTAHETAEVADDPVVLQLENTMVAKAFAALPERWQVVLWHTQVEGQSPAEVGVLLGMTANAVTSLAFRAREGLREAYLQAHLADTAAERCRATVDRLGGWARGGLSQREKAQVDAHLAECDRCRALAAELAEINSGLRALLAPLLLGGAAAGYLATTSSSGAALLVTGGAAGAGAAVGAGAGASAGAGGGSSGGSIASFLAKPWSLAAGGAVVVAAVVATLVITLTGGHTNPAADRPPATTPGPVVTSTAAVTTPDASPGSPGPAAPPPQPQVPPVAAPPAPTSPATSRTSTSHTSSARAAPPVVGVPPPAPATPPATPPARTAGPTAAATPTSGAPTTASTATTVPTTAPTTPSPSTSRPQTTTPPTTTTTTPTLAAVSDPRFAVATLDATAGASATVSFSVANSGGTASASQELRVGTPTGVSVTDVRVSGVSASGASAPPAPGLRRASALLATSPQAPAGTTALTCTTTWTCTYTVPARTLVTITLSLAIAPDATPGDLTLTINGASAGARLPLHIAPGLTGLQLEPPADWTIGIAAPSHLTGTVTTGVTDVGTISIPLHGEGIWFAPDESARPNHCAVRGADLTCTSTDIVGGTVDFGSVMATAVLPGGITATASLPGAGGTLTVEGPAGAPLSARAPSTTGGPISLTGPFGGAVVGAAAMECAAPYVPRGGCGELSDVRLPQRLGAVVPTGATIVSATLTWAASTLADEDDASTFDSVMFHACPADVDPSDTRCAGRAVGPTDVTAPTQDPQHPMYVRAADVTGMVRGADQVWADGITASRGDVDDTQPMAGWSLTVIWSGPGLSATVDVSNPSTYSGSGAPTVPMAPAGAQISDVTAVIWGADPWGTKHIDVAGDHVEPHAIEGVRSGCVALDPAAECATGVDVISGIRAPADEPVTLTNHPAHAVGPWRVAAGNSNQDDLWIGPTVVVRKAQ